MKSILVWDLPIRLFHWTLAALVAAAAITANIGGNAMDSHGAIGLAIVGLLAFRLVWGVIGTTHARFASFVRGPATIRAYLRGAWPGPGRTCLGHNPLGALSVLALLGTLCLQVGTGLFSNDDIAFTGPLHQLVSKETSDRLTGLHHRGVWLVGVLVGLHLGAIAFYRRFRQEDLIKPMLTGHKQTDDGQAQPSRGGGPVALALAVAVACGAAWAASGGLLPEAPPVMPATDPGW